MAAGSGCAGGGCGLAARSIERGIFGAGGGAAGAREGARCDAHVARWRGSGRAGREDRRAAPCALLIDELAEGVVVLILHVAEGEDGELHAL